MLLLQFGKLLVPQFHQSLIQNPLIRLVTHLCDKTRLLSTQNIPGSSNIQILHGNIEPTPQTAEILDCLQPSPGIRIH